MFLFLLLCVYVFCLYLYKSQYKIVEWKSQENVSYSLYRMRKSKQPRALLWSLFHIQNITIQWWYTKQNFSDGVKSWLKDFTLKNLKYPNFKDRTPFCSKKVLKINLCTRINVIMCKNLRYPMNNFTQINVTENFLL